MSEKKFDGKKTLDLDGLPPEEKEELLEFGRKAREEQQAAREAKKLADPEGAEAAEKRRAFEKLQRRLRAVLEQKEQRVEHARSELRSMQRLPSERTLDGDEPASVPTERDVAEAAERLREAVTEKEDAELALKKLEHEGTI